MLKMSFEFRKGIFFIRLIGDLNKESYKNIEDELNELITINKFKYIVINTNYLRKIDLIGLNYITEIVYMTRENDSNLVICDKNNIINRLLSSRLPNIATELDVL